MAIREIALYNHRGSWTLKERQLKERIEAIINQNPAKLQSVEAYLMKDSSSKYETGGGNKLNIFIGATPGSSNPCDYAITTTLGTYAFSGFLPKDQEYAPPIMDDNNQIVGYFSERHTEYYIPFTIDEIAPEDATDIILYSIQALVDKVFAEYSNRNSWIKSKNKEGLLQSLTAHLTRDREGELETVRRTIADAESRIRSYTQDLKASFDRATKAKRDLKAIESSDVNGMDSFIKGLDLIAQHPQVSNLLIEENEVTVYIDKVHAYADIDGEDQRFYIGNMHVKMNIGNTDVKFFGDNPRDGFWTRDPHPHVNGADGRACLGNVSATIAELCSQKEIYPLFLTCLDFLENANTDDPAGAKVVMWDQVDESGNVVVKGGERGDTFYCQHCEEEHSEHHESYTVYTRFVDGDVTNDQTWCGGCREDHAYYADEVEEYVHDNLQDAIEAHFEEEE